MRRTRVFFCAIGAISILTIGHVGLARGQAVQEVENTKYDTSPPLSSLQPQIRVANKQESKVKKLPLPAVRLGPFADTVLQTRATRTLPIGPVGGFQGIGVDLKPEFAKYAPSDATGAVGQSYYVQWANTNLAIFEKATGSPKLGPIPGSTVWRGFGGNCEAYNDGDPVVLFDRIEKRWLLTQFAIQQQPFSQCLAVSVTDDPSGAYARYEFQFADFNDYPKFGVWPGGYFASFNMFKDDTFTGVKACAFERDKMLKQQSAKMQCFDAAVSGLLPSDLDGERLPPDGSTNYFVGLSSTANQLKLWQFHVDWSDKTKSKFSGPAIIKDVAPFEGACRTSPRNACVVQPGTNQRLDALSDRLMYRLAYRNFGSHESLVVNHTVSTPTGAGIRWYELRDLMTDHPRAYAQGTYAPTGGFRWLGSAAMDKNGNTAIGYNMSGSTTSPGIRISGRTFDDPRGELRAEQPIAPGGGKGVQSTAERWGDYSSMTLDPGDDCTFWFTTQYIAKPAGRNDENYNWGTRVVNFRFSNCQ